MRDKDLYKATFSNVRISADIRNRILECSDDQTRIPHSKNKLVLAAIIMCLFLLTAYTCVRFHVYENPEEMLEGILGENGRPTYSAEQVMTKYGPYMQYGGGTRYELDVDLAYKYIAPHIYEVNQTSVDRDQILTVEACIVDKASLTGAIYFRLENPPQYTISNRGAISWFDENGEIDYTYITIEMDGCNTIGNFMIVEEMTSNEVLYGTFQFAVEKDCDWIRVRLKGSDDEITIPIPEKATMPALELDDGGVTLSPFGACLDAAKYEITFRTRDVINIMYTDGKSFELQWEDQKGEEPHLEDSRYGCNVSFFTDSGNVVYVFSKVLDIENVRSIIINGTEYSVE